MQNVKSKIVNCHFFLTDFLSLVTFDDLNNVAPKFHDE